LAPRRRPVVGGGLAGLTASKAHGCCFGHPANDNDGPEMLCLQHRSAIDAVGGRAAAASVGH
jgi:hypothetical protein